MMNLPQYTKKDAWIFAGMSIPFVIFLNTVLFGKRYFLEPKVFVFASVITCVIIGLSWLSHTWVAVTLRNRFSKNSEIIKRLALAILLFILMTAITITLLFWGYDYFNFLGYEIDEERYDWALAGGVVVNIFATLVHEGVSGFEKWKTTLTETEQLKKAYMQSQLLGLKSQVSPHFLFNSLNSLSSLISDDPDQAEIFLDEMSKVYRYLLKTNEEQVVPLGTELQFVHSYFHLLKTRYGQGVHLETHVDEPHRQMLLPPLTLQILLDNIFKMNLISRDSPLAVSIYVKEEGWLEIKNNVQRRISDPGNTDESAIVNMSNKFRLLCHKAIEMEVLGNYRILKVPLMHHEEIPAYASV